MSARDLSARCVGTGPVRVGTGTVTSSSLYPSMRSPKLTMHAIDSPLARKSTKASARRVAEARKYLTLPGSDGRS